MKENLKNVNEKTKKYKTEQCEFKDSKNNEFVTDDFNWLKDV